MGRVAEGLVLVHFHNNCITIPLGLLIERNSLSLGLQHVQIVFSRSLSGVFFRLAFWPFAFVDTTVRAL